ncbi:MAG: HAMP domain-containing histidine kinase [Clostridiales bacterium]|nr:HAMP domain-containing histidine kinase [Clostridiales bacterium]
MKIKGYIIIIVLIVMTGCAGLFILANKQFDISLDTVAVNDIVSALKAGWPGVEEVEPDLPGLAYGIDYAVINKDGHLLKATKRGISEDENAAVAHRDTIVSIYGKDDAELGKVIFYNDTEEKLWQYQSELLNRCAGILLLCGLLGLFWVIWVNRRILKPFGRLKYFASNVAGGNLDIPLPMEKGGAFGAFSESFDLMRVALAEAREKEQKANKSKKELVASLSHDIKTPVASIKALSELMAVSTPDQKTKKQLETITEKADQIDLLISNMFHATLEELQELKVAPQEVSSRELIELIKTSDYLNLAALDKFPDCLVIADPMRLSQVFDNIFSNSYKYANTKIKVSAHLTDTFCLEFTDFGKGVPPEELPLLKQKYFRGKNAGNKSGAGIGLFISSYFMQQMKGSLKCISKDGFTVSLVLMLA